MSTKKPAPVKKAAARKVAVKASPVSNPVDKSVDKKPSRSSVDWEAVEANYRTGVLSVRQLAKEYGVSHVAIGKRAKEHGWSRDLAAQIRAKTDAKVNKAAVTAEVTARKAVTESAIIEANAEARAAVVLGHRKDIVRSKTLLANLMSELEQQTEHLELFEQLGELLDETDTDEKGRLRIDKLNQIYRKVISTPGRVDSFKKLADVLAITIKLEREAWSIGDGTSEKTDVEEMLENVAKKLGLDQ